VIELLGKLLRQRQFWHAIAAILACVATYFFLPVGVPEVGRRVAVVFLFAVLFWAFEIIPLYATSLAVVILLCFLMTGIGQAGYQQYLAPFSSPIIMLFLGGLVMAEAARRHQIDLFLMEKMLLKVGHRPTYLLLGVLCTAAFFSLWISNTAATAMMLMLVAPILSRIEQDDPLRKGLVIAVAFGANIGGIGTPIGTPPNAIAIGILRDYGIEVGFLDWMMIAIPLVIILLLATALVLRFLFPPKAQAIAFTLEEPAKLTPQGKSVIGLSILIIALWLTKPLHHIPEELVALLGVGLFAGLRLISVEEIRHVPWDVLILMWGGLALGEAVQSSGLVEQLGHVALFSQTGLTLVIIFSMLAVILTSVISNTAAANLLLPIAISLDPSVALILAVAVALSCSFAFVLPISTPPNALAYATGQFTVREMFKSGTILSIIAIVIMLFGVKAILALGF
jgi:solute carrier family 13 (sodium-dependent dicarboxylate transporter), member 2/3/5